LREVDLISHIAIDTKRHVPCHPARHGAADAEGVRFSGANRPNQLTSKGMHMNNARTTSSSNWRRISGGILIAASALTLTGLTGCVVTPVHPRFAGEVVMVAPPAPQVEVIGVPPVPGHTWIAGYWGWVGGRHVWVGGHWDAPRPGYYWEPHVWVHTGAGWQLREGHWARR
jgi:hypothetical protein